MPKRKQPWMIRITANDIINTITFDSIDLLTEDENREEQREQGPQDRTGGQHAPGDNGKTK